MDFKDLFTTKNIIIFLIILIFVIGIFYYSRNKFNLENFQNNLNSDTIDNQTPTLASGDSPFNTYQTTNLDKPDPYSTPPNRTPMNPSELLPNITNANWGNLYPVKNDGGVYVPSMIDPSFSIGINSISNSMKNQSLDIRSTPVIVKQQVSPWNNSSYQMDITKIGLDPAPSIVN